jgi:hypothetical protein
LIARVVNIVQCLPNMISIREHVLTGRTALWFAMGGMARFVVLPSNPVVSIIVGDVLSTTISVLHEPESKKPSRKAGIAIPATQTMVGLGAFMTGWVISHAIVVQKLEGDVANLDSASRFWLHIALIFAVIIAVVRYVRW